MTTKLMLMLIIALNIQGCMDNHSQPHDSGAIIISQPSSGAFRSGKPTQTATDLRGEPIWVQQVEDMRFEWTTSDLTVHYPMESFSVFGSLVRAGFKDFTDLYISTGNVEGNDGVSNCSYERTFKVLSVVEKIVSFEDRYFDYCGGIHPSVSTRFTTVDLTKPGGVLYAHGEETPMMDVNSSNPGKIVSLTHYFDEQDILRALLANSDIVEGIAKKKPRASVRKLSEFSELFAADFYQLGESGFELRPDFLTRFAFHHVENDNVIVHVGLPPHYGANKAAHRVISLSLPIPTKLQKALNLANFRQQGFLMKDANQVSQGRLTKISIKGSHN